MIFLSRSLIFLLSWSCNVIIAQNITFVSSAYDHTLNNWILYDSNEVEIGELNSSGIPHDVFNTWNIRLGENSGFIKRRWKENLDLYDLQFSTSRLNFAPIWPGHFDQWKLNDNQQFYDFTLQLNTNGLFGSVKNSKNELVFELSNIYSLDPRDWVVNYSKNEDLNSLVLVASFILIHYHQYFIR
ncbi:MAG: hypothetical protein IT267_08350 [Saprospiraceae bacterium]|nr:hypothetical protein [Saprospiraceae bacterium]